MWLLEIIALVYSSLRRMRKKPTSFQGFCRVRLDLRLLQQDFHRYGAYVIRQNTLENEEQK